MKIAIVGAGWYGCHLATVLSELYHVTLFESGEDIFSGISGRNTNRLHNGFHYPRDYETRRQTKEGYKLFQERYPNFLSRLDKNIYAISKEKSMMDYPSYKMILDSEKLNYKEIDTSDLIDSETIEGSINADELLISPEKAKNFFRDKLNKVNLQLSTTVDKTDLLTEFGGKYDWVINTTWCSIDTGLFKDMSFRYDPGIIFYYESYGESNYGITMMDGDLFTLYPVPGEKNIFSVWSVNDSKITSCLTYIEAENKIKSLKQEDIEKRRHSAETLLLKYIPSFKNKFKYYEYKTTIKPRRTSLSDPRFCAVRNSGNLIDVFSGKIDTIFEAEKRVLEIIG